MSLLFRLFAKFNEAAKDGGESAAGGGDNSTVDSTPSQPDAATIERARSMGWSTKDQWKGDPKLWIDAAEFVRRGDQILPILRARESRQESEIATLRGQLGQANSQLKAAQESISVLTNLSNDEAIARAKALRKDLLRQQVEARNDNDTEAQVTIGERLEEVNEQISTLGKKKATPSPSPSPSPSPTPGQSPSDDPIFKQWASENQWFGTDEEKTSLAMGVARRLRQAGDSTQGRAFFDKVTNRVNELLNRHMPSKTEGGGASGGRGGSGDDGGSGANGQTYADLPQDAKDACERSAKRVVGEGRAFKTIGDWRKHYVKEYFSS